MIEQPDIMGGSKEAPPGPYKKAADDYCEYHRIPRRSVGTDENGEVYQIARTHHSDAVKFRRGYDNIEWD